MKTPEQIVNGVIANAELAGGVITPEHRERLRQVAAGEITAEEAVNEVILQADRDQERLWAVMAAADGDW